MRKSRITIPLLSLAVVLLISGYVFGVSSYTSSFNTLYGTTAGTALGANSSANCVLCHPNGNTGQFTSYATAFRNNNHDYAAIEPLDSDGDGCPNVAEITDRTRPDVNSSVPASCDAVLPVASFTIPGTSGSLAVPITLTATDNVGVAGYMVRETSARPSAYVTGWTASAPTSYTFGTAGAKTLYAWAKDAKGNVSLSRSDGVTITITTTDTTRPTVNTFTIPTSASSLTVPITSFTASDNTGGSGVNGYLVTATVTAPTAAAAGWSTTAPTSFSFPAGTTSGAKTLYAWARDAAGNVSNSLSRTVTVTLPPAADTTLPVVSGFTVGATAGSLTVSITSFSATDNVGVTGYLVNESPTKPAATAAGWTAAVPTGYTFASAGSKTLYGWAKDAAGNVSNGVSRTVTVTSGGGGEADVESPEVMEFTLPLTSTSLTVPIVAFRAIDNVGASAYLITTTPTAPAATASGWSATPPTSYTFSSAGAKTLYGWAKDAAGNVSESVWDNVDITVAGDRTAPSVTEFLLPRQSESLTVPILSFRATDNVGVTGYMVTTSSTRPGASSSYWRSTPPTSYRFTSEGTKRLYPWVKDAAGNVSALWSGTATVYIDLDDEEEEDD